MKVAFKPAVIDGKDGLDLVINDASATVADLIEAVQPWCSDDSIHKQYLEEKRGSCEGCPVNCCRECLVIPDIVSYHRLRRELAVSSQDFFASYIDQEYLRQGLPCLKSSPCVFLRERLCGVYASRTLICRLYLCTPMSDRAFDITYRVIAAGMGEFLRLAREEGHLGRDARPGAGSYARMLWDLVFQESVRPDNPFYRAASYGEVSLQPFLDGANGGTMTGEKGLSSS